MARKMLDTCPKCGGRKSVGSAQCLECYDADRPTPVFHPDRPPGRKRTYTDDDIVAAVLDSDGTVDDIMRILGAKHKNNLLTRLRAIPEVHITERPRRLGFTVTVKGENR